MTIWKQERPIWCQHKDCIFARRVQDSICGGNLPKKEPHDFDFNHYRVCMRFRNDDTFNFVANNSDLDYLRWIFDALDGKKTSQLSRA